MFQIIFTLVVVFIVLTFGSVILRFMIPLVGIECLLLFIFGTGGFGIIPLMVLLLCYITKKTKDAGHI